MESWRRCFRDGVAPLLSTEALEALRKAVMEDSPELIQGATTSPPPLMSVAQWPVEAACLLGYCGWRGEDLATVAEVEEYFARICYEADLRMGEPAAVRYLLTWFDETERGAMRRELLPELNRELALRQEQTETCAV